MPSFETFDFAQTAIQATPRLWGYLDPGMGSMLFQVLLAGALSASFFLRAWVRQVREMLLIKTRKS
jgi:hypothetical protein